LRISKFRFSYGVLIFAFLLIFYSPMLFSQAGMGKGRINGVVVDEEGNPIENVVIVAQSLKNKETKLKGTSDAEGNWAIGGLGTGYWRITANKSGYSSSFVELDVSQVRRNPPITFTLKKARGAAVFLVNEEARIALDQGNQLMQEKKYDEAIAIFQQLIDTYPTAYQVRLNLGECFMKKDEMDKAEEQFNKVLETIKAEFNEYKKDPYSSSKALSALAQVSLKKNDLKSAQNYFTQALEISPANEVLAYNVGEIYFANQEIDTAISYFQKAVEIKKDWSPPYLKLGYAYLNKGDNEKALEYLQKFLELDPESPDAPVAQEFINMLKKEQ
jgi:tetratricopeptide (TPR) repeat protein